MNRERDIKLDEFELSVYAFREVRNFCLQYHEKLAKVNSIYGLSAAPISAMPKGNSVGNPTEKAVVRAERYSSDCRLIENTIREVLQDKQGLFPWMLRAITEEHATFEKLGPPCGRVQFYRARRMVYFRLSERIRENR